ncbi:LacI family DNA-binding transcriptional regulator [Lachnoclostridium phytofermentans]|uniref:Transcriptional regulator, LacI family n=1 Tax=Lachnoclostridium phytofermentans (strain ATCC 700394 / DSM 18823 / ISDg) TaxID=357809 RepID=A9KJT0_LACP7|nr:LacI family DNA-binding transcriptional regulator [Lachnoclostridium phytofermentans]ABX41085.1 transcriptional regulator, LacI family [Lachnoclostridium phytofermentans ISDg]
MANINIKDIARLSGVGIATVSRVINQTGAVSEKTKKKVMDVINEYNYIPNNNARNLKLTQSENIALIVKYMSNPFFIKMIDVIEIEMASRGFPLLIQNVDESSDELDIAISESMHSNLCGIIIMGGSYSSYTEAKFKQLGIPCVLLTVNSEGNVDPSLYSSVIIDDEKEAYKATKYLIDMGHTNIGFLYKDVGNLVTPNILRYQGYKRALLESGIPLDENLVSNGTPASGAGFRVGFLAMKQLMQKNPSMTAVFAFSDVLAIGAAKAALASGKRIPEDISIIGFDGIEMTEFYNPSLDTVYQPAIEMALSAVSMLHGMMNGEKSQHMVYDSVIMKRGSVKNIQKP